MPVAQLPFRFSSLRNQTAQQWSFKTPSGFHRPSNSNDLTRPLDGNECKWVGNGDSWRMQLRKHFSAGLSSLTSRLLQLGGGLCLFCFFFFFKKAMLASLLPLASSFLLKLHFFCPPQLGHFCLRYCF